MTTALEERLAPVAPATEPEPPADGPVAVPLTCAAAALATGAAAWMLAGVFDGALAKVVAVLAALVGPGMVALSQRTARPALVQYLVLPVALVLGALLVLPGATGGSANLPSLVEEAVRSGGLGQPPVVFELGWRFVLVVLLVLLGAGAAAVATSTDRPRLGILIPLPVVLGAALIQPPASATLTTAIALVLMVGALVLASGAQLIASGSSSTAFELRRITRGLGALALLAAVLVPLSTVGGLFPKPSDDTVIPPHRPSSQPPLSDRVLFTVDTTEPGPWRFGVLDVYRDGAWMLPPYDRKRFVKVGGSGDLAALVAEHPARPGDGPSGIPTTPADRRVHVTIGDLPGRSLPVLEGVVSVVPDGADVEFDPRTQVLRSAKGRVTKGRGYTIAAAPLPGAKVLEAAPPASTTDLAPYLDVPAPPDEVTALLATAPTTNAFDRLQFLRQALYSKVVAAGQGKPVDVPVSRVPQMLAGGEATPFEITAAEALLARWAGVPSRIGFGFYRGVATADGSGRELHPKDGATWLEVYFPGPGWVSIVGQPPKAKASTSLDDKKTDARIRPADDLNLVVHVPVELQSLQQVYELVRFYLLVSVPWVLLAVGLLVFYPAGFKVARRWRRRAWGRRHGPAGRVLVAYADLRDRLIDVHAPDPAATPLEFVHCVEADEEHWELAWLVTRALWGDLARDLRIEDAEAAEDMSASVATRVLRAQRPVARALGLASRTSLKAPYSTEIPNLWPARPSLRLPRRRWRFATAVLALLGLVSCGAARAVPPPSLPARLLPAAVGSYVLQHEPAAEKAFAEAGSASLVTQGTVYTIRRGGDVFGSFQAAAFKPSVHGNVKKVQKSLRANIGSGDFTLQRLGDESVYELRQGSERVLLWFPPGGGYYEMLDVRSGFDDADKVFLAILGYQHNGSTDRGTPAQLVDIRRGGD